MTICFQMIAFKSSSINAVVSNLNIWNQCFVNVLFHDWSKDNQISFISFCIRFLQDHQSESFCIHKECTWCTELSVQINAMSVTRFESDGSVIFNCWRYLYAVISHYKNYWYLFKFVNRYGYFCMSTCQALFEIKYFPRYPSWMK